MMISRVGIVCAGGLLLGCGGGNVPVSGDSTVSLAVDDESGSVCATRADGRYRCWGPDATPASVPPLPAADYVRVQLTPAGLAGLTREGAVNAVGTPVPADLPPIAGFRAVNMWGSPGLCLRTGAGDFLYGAYDPAGNFFPDGTTERWRTAKGPFIDAACAFEGLYGAIRADGTTWDGGNGLLPGNDWKRMVLSVKIACGLTTSGDVRCLPRSIVPTDPPPSFPPGPYLQVAATYQVACALRADGAIACSRFDGAAVAALPGRYVFIDAGRDLLCGVRTDGTSACFRQSGDGVSTFEDYTIDGFTPAPVPIDEGW